MAALDHGAMAWDAELQIDRVTDRDDAEATVVARCVRGPVRLGTRFRHVSEAAAPIDLELTRILIFGRVIDVLVPAQTALVTLRGTGTRHLRTGDITLGWQIIQGGDPKS